MLDTHAVLWSLVDSPRLSARVRAALLDPPVHVTARAQGFALLPITHRHAALAAGLPLANRDPWDRILVAQSGAEGALLVSADGAVSALGATVFW